MRSRSPLRYARGSHKNIGMNNPSRPREKRGVLRENTRLLGGFVVSCQTVNVYIGSDISGIHINLAVATLYFRESPSHQGARHRSRL
jgi:hypothetical protein